MRSGIRVFLVIIVLVVLGVGGWLYLQSRVGDLPDGFAQANGRIEAERVDVALRFAGRVAEVLVDEGQIVGAGDIIARIDSVELEARIRAAQAATRQARQELVQAQAVVAQREGELTFAEAELNRTETLVDRGFATGETLDQRRSLLITAVAALNTAHAQVGLAEASIEASEANVAALNANLADYTLIAPRDGRVQYRMAEPGEILAAGGRVVSLLDLTDVYMDIYLPTDDAGQLRLRDDARIILDAAPEFVIPATIVFVASEAQFTPRYVETESERERLMFRIKLQIPADLLIQYQDVVMTGVPGVGIVRIDEQVEWPEALAVSLP